MLSITYVIKCLALFFFIVICYLTHLTSVLHSFIPFHLQALSWKWLFGATAVAIGSVALSVVIAARN